MIELCRWFLGMDNSSVRKTLTYQSVFRREDPSVQKTLPWYSCALKTLPYGKHLWRLRNSGPGLNSLSSKPVLRGKYGVFDRCRTCSVVENLSLAREMYHVWLLIQSPPSWENRNSAELCSVAWSIFESFFRKWVWPRELKRAINSKNTYFMKNEWIRHPGLGKIHKKSRKNKLYVGIVQYWR